MFSFNPFVYNYSRPKSYGLIDDDYFYPFSSDNYYVRDQPPSLFRTSSFRRPQSCYQPSYQLPIYQQQQENCKSDEEDQFDPFLDVFRLRSSKRNKQNENNNSGQAKSNDNQVKSNDNKAKSNKVKSDDVKQKVEDSKKSTVVQEKWLDSQRFDTDNEIEFKFNYKCTSPSDVSIEVTKDNYIVLKTIDNRIWKSRIPDNVDVFKASCQLINGRLSLKLPLKSLKIENRVQINKCDNNRQIKSDEVQKSNDDVKKDVQDKKSKVTKDDESDKKMDEEFDPDAPIVEDIYEDMN